MDVLVTPEISKKLDHPQNFDISKLAPTPIDTQVLRRYLDLYDHPDASILHSGFSEGFTIHYSGTREARECGNLKSAVQNPEVVQKKLDKEIKAGRMAGPFDTKPFSNFIVSPVGLVPKRTTGDFRLIHHLSYPEGNSINSNIERQFCSVSYTSFDKAVHMIQDLGKNCKLFKMDLKNAFRLLPISPSDFELLGISFKGKFYCDKALPFGAAVSCQTFEKFSTFLEAVVSGKMPSGRLLHYLDDFLGGDKTYATCARIMSIFSNTMSELCVPLAEEKTEGPTEVIIFLGLELDSNKMEVRIPLAKISEIVVKINNLLQKSKATLKELQSLIGSLNFCCRAIPLGRPFSRRLVNAICGLTKSHYHIRVSCEMKLDLQMWLSFFQNHNGISVFHDRFWVSNIDVSLYTDSAGGSNRGFGAFFKGHWCQGRWPSAWYEVGLTKNITALELFPIFVAIVVWGQELQNKKIRFHCDNEAVVAILNSLTSKSNEVMRLVRKLTLLCLQRNILLKAEHIPGTNNEICDALSRFQDARFRALAPEADALPASIPDEVWSIFNPQP